MKIQATNPWEASQDAHIQPLSVDQESISKIVGLLSKNIYSAKSSAFREYWLNARESHQAARNNGKSPRPMEITLPYKPTTSWWGISPTARQMQNPSDNSTQDTGLPFTTIVAESPHLMFTIRDYGESMDRDTLITMVSSAGASSKSTNNEYGGGMGIGSLSGFSVSDQIMIQSFHNGKSNTVILSADSHAWSILDEIDTDEDDGVKVSFSVADEKTAEYFTVGALQYLVYSRDTDMVVSCGNESYFETAMRQNKELQSREPYRDRTTTINDTPVTLTAFTSLHSIFGKIHTDNPMMRIDGCLYNVSSSTTLKDAISKKILERINKGIGASSVCHTDSTDSDETQYQYAVNDIKELFFNHSPEIESIIIDTGVGAFNQKIQPSREIVTLDDQDIDILAESYMDLCEKRIDQAIRYIRSVDQFKEDSENSPASTKNIHSGFHMPSVAIPIEKISRHFYVSCSTPENITKLCQKLGNARTHFMKHNPKRDELFGLAMWPTVDKYYGDSTTSIKTTFTLDERACDYNGVHNNTGYLFSRVENHDDLVACYSITLRKNGAATITFEKAVEKDSVVLLESTTQKMNTASTCAELIAPYNARVEDAKKLYVGTHVFVNTPLVNKCVLKDPHIALKFQGSDTIVKPNAQKFTDLRKTVASVIAPAKKKSTVSYNTLLITPTEYDQKGYDKCAALGEYKQRNLDDIIQLSDDHEAPILMMDKLPSTVYYSDEYAERFIDYIKVAFDNSPTVVVFPKSNAQKFNTMTARVRKTAGDDRCYTDHNLNILELAAPRLDDTTKSRLSVFYAVGENFVNNPVSIQSLREVLNATGHDELSDHMWGIMGDDAQPSVEESVIMRKCITANEETIINDVDADYPKKRDIMRRATKVLTMANITLLRETLPDKEFSSVITTLFNNCGE